MKDDLSNMWWILEWLRNAEVLNIIEFMPYALIYESFQQGQSLLLFYPSFTFQIFIEQFERVRHWDTTSTKTCADSKILKI